MVSSKIQRPLTSRHRAREAAPPRTERWDRDEGRARLEAEAWDVVVVGGGVTGAGVARDAALRGLKVACLEAGDWAGGTSSRTTKFAHGGLRYLEMLDFGLVHAALAERATLLAIAPHLTRATPFLLPIYAGRTRPSWKLRIGLTLYDALAGGTRLGRHQMLDRRRAMIREPLLQPDRLRGAGVYWDARVRDARLVVETIGDARRAGAAAVTYCRVHEIEPWGDGWVGEVEDRLDGSRFVLRGRVWVNGTGPWTDRLRSQVAPGRTPLLGPTKGVHIVVRSERLAVRDPTALFASDGRLYFAVPEGPWTYVGTTDTVDGGNVDDFGVTSSDVSYLVEAVGDATASRIAAEDVVAAWAGWRPLAAASSGASLSRISREDVIEETAPGLITVAGGKLTTYRRMAEVATDRAVAMGGWRTRSCVTGLRPLVPPELGGEGPDPTIEPDSAARVRGLFGPDADDVFARWKEDRETAVPLGDTFPFTAAEVERAAREMVVTLDDLVDRRLLPLPEGAPLDRDTLGQTASAASAVTGWDADRQREEVDRFRSRIDRWPARPGVRDEGSNRVDG